MRPEDFNISKEKLVFRANDDKIHDLKLDTKPVSYFKDAFYRFSRNKASIVAACIIIFLVLFAIIVVLYFIGLGVSLFLAHKRGYGDTEKLEKLKPTLKSCAIVVVICMVVVIVCLFIEQ